MTSRFKRIALSIRGFLGVRPYVSGAGNHDSSSSYEEDRNPPGSPGSETGLPKPDQCISGASPMAEGTASRDGEQCPQSSTPKPDETIGSESEVAARLATSWSSPSIMVAPGTEEEAPRSSSVRRHCSEPVLLSWADDGYIGYGIVANVFMRHGQLRTEVTISGDMLAPIIRHTVEFACPVSLSNGDAKIAFAMTDTGLAFQVTVGPLLLLQLTEGNKHISQIRISRRSLMVITSSAAYAPFLRLALNYGFSPSTSSTSDGARIRRREINVPALPVAELEKIPQRITTEADMVDKVQCMVCFEDFQLGEEVRVLPCGHMYHETCVFRWLKLHNRCPACGKPVGGNP